MPDERDEWRQLHQCLPLNVYTRLIDQLHRIAVAQGMTLLQFDSDNKKAKQVGARVLTFEVLVILLEATDSEAFKIERGG